MKLPKSRAFNAMVAQLRAAKEKAEFEKTQLEMAIHAVDAGVYDIRVDDSSLYRSRRLKDIIGVAELPATRRAWRERIHPDDVGAYVKRIEDLQTGRIPTYRAEYRIRHDDGDYRWIRERGRLFRDMACSSDRIVGLLIDVTEQKETETALRQSQQRFKALVNSLPHAVYMKDTAGRYLFANPTHTSSLGLSSDDVAGTTVRAFFPPETVERIETHDRQVIEEQRVVRTDVEVETPSGKALCLDVTKYPVFDADGNVIAVGGMNVDVTERHRSEKALVDSERKFQALLDNLPYTLFMKNIACEYILISPSFYERRGHNPNSVLGKTSSEIFPAQFAARADATDREVITEHRSVRYETELRDNEGRVQHFDVTKFPVFGGSGELIGLAGIAVDISEQRRAEESRRQSEQHLKMLIENLPFSVFMKDLDGRFRYVAPIMAEKLGLQISEILGKTVFDLAPADEVDEYVASDREVFETRRPVTFELETNLGPGPARILEVTKFPVTDTDGALLGIAGLRIDVTERRRMERELSESQGRLEALIRNMPFPISLKDLEGRFQYVGPLTAKNIGRDISEILGKTPYELAPLETAERYMALDREVLEVRRPIAREFDTVFNDGQTRTLVVTKFPVIDSDGQLTGIAGLSMDVTERRRIERQLSESQGRFQALINNLPHPIYMKDTSGRYVLFSPSYARDVGCAADAALGKTVFDLFPKEAAEAATALDRQVIASGKPVRGEVNYRDNTGGTRIYDVTKFPIFDADGELVGLAGMNIEITAQRRAEKARQDSEQSLRALIENLPFALSMSGLDGRYTMASPILARNLGREIGDILGRTVNEVVPKETAEVYAEMEENVCVSRRPVTREITTGCTAGSARVLEVTTFPVLDADGDLIGLAGFNLDITERRRTEERLAEAQRMEMVGQLAGGIAHDFNNLLAVIRGNLELVEDEEADDFKVGKRLRASLRAVRRGADLTERLLAVGRRQSLRADTAHVPDLLGQTVEVLTSVLGKDIDVQIEYQPGLWPVYIDPGRLEDALLNIALNARAAMPDGGHLQIRADNARTAAAEADGGVATGDYVILSVVDDGTGIPSDVRPHILEPFYTTKEHGTGLGLSMAYGFLRQSGGTLTITSEQGHGTKVSLYLPRASAALSKRPSALTRPVAHRGLALVVDDDPEMSAIVERQLCQLGYDTHCTGDTETASIWLAKNARVTLLVTDIVLGHEMKGIALARKARWQSPNLPVILISGQATQSDLDEPDELTAFLRKPLGRDELAARVRALLDHSSTTTLAQNV